MYFYISIIELADTVYQCFFALTFVLNTTNILFIKTKFRRLNCLLCRDILAEQLVSYDFRNLHFLTIVNDASLCCNRKHYNV